MQSQKPKISISAKANKVLNVIFIILLCITIKVWHLSVVQHEELSLRAHKPQTKTLIERAERGSIRDRFNISLAVNKVRYNASIVYSQFKTIPRLANGIDEDGNAVRVYKRKRHIKGLSEVLGKALNMDSERIEDMIYSKAALLPNVPYVIKEEISEIEYFKLKLLEKDWLGLQANLSPQRFYPKGKTGCDIVGYLGSISASQYRSISKEIKELTSLIKDDEEGNAYNLPENIKNIENVRQRLKILEERSYSINDLTGKTGIEFQLDEQLRGFCGKRQFHVDARGSFLREKPGGHNPIPGQRVLLTISSELQEYAEQLLAQNERIRDGKSVHYDINENKYTHLKQPWIKGGAIVAMDPNNGEILAMASYPRFNPNDFISSGDPETQKKKNSAIYHWLEGEPYISEIWNGTAPLERENFSSQKGIFETEEKVLSWDNFLQQIFPLNNDVYKALQRHNTIGTSIELQKNILLLKNISKNDNITDILNAIYDTPQNKLYKKNNSSKKSILENISKNKGEFNKLKNSLDKYFGTLKHNYDKLLLLDLLSLAAQIETFDKTLLVNVENISLSEQHKSMQDLHKIKETIYEMFKELFKQYHFKPWLEDNKESFLKQKRREEDQIKTYHHPYLDLLDKQEKSMREAFWEQYSKDIMTAFLMGKEAFAYISEDIAPYIDYFASWQTELAHGAHQGAEWYNSYNNLKQITCRIPPELLQSYLVTLRSYRDLNKPLHGKYRHLRQEKNLQTEKHLAASFYPQYGFGYGRSYAFRQAAPQGSIFKLVTAYAGLSEYYKKIAAGESVNPFTIFDNPHLQANGKRWNIGKYTNGNPISQYYKGGRLPRSARRNIGEIGITKAIETSSNPYFSMMAGDLLEDPEQLNEISRQLGFGEKTGIELPGEIAGSLPKDLRDNKTGLYSHAIGQHSLVVTPLQTTLMLATIANGGSLYQPKIIKMIAGKNIDNREKFIDDNEGGLFPEAQSSLGIDFALFKNPIHNYKKNVLTNYPTLLKNKIDMAPEVRNTILEGTHAVINKPGGCAYINRIRNYKNNPEAMRSLSKLRKKMCGKTGTAERVETVTLDINTGTYIYKHIWFGGIAFKDKIEETASLSYDKYGKPEIVVVVYLCYGDYGRETAPLAAQIIDKWHAIKKEH